MNSLQNSDRKRHEENNSEGQRSIEFRGTKLTPLKEKEKKKESKAE